MRRLLKARELESVARTHRAVVVDEGWRSGSLSAEISARLTETLFYDLDAPVLRVCSAEVPMPYAHHLEQAALPQVPGIVVAVKEAVPKPGKKVAPRQEETAAKEETSSPRARSKLVRVEAERLGIDLATVHGSGPRGLITREDVRQAALHRRRVRSSPYARKRAGELGIDLESVAGTGPDGAVRAADLMQAGHAKPAAVEAPAARAVEARPLARQDARDSDERSNRQLAMRQAIGALMARSKRIPHYYLSTTIDLSAATNWLRARNAGRPPNEQLTSAALLFNAAALACREVPDMNGFWLEDQFSASPAVHLGIAISLRGGGLLAPAIHDADTLAVADLMGRLRDLVSRARTGRLRSAEMRDPSITVTNLGDRGVESVLGVIYPPQVALVGFGKVVDRPWAVDGMPTVRPVVTATLAADHRAISVVRSLSD
ncbi:MAG TPA: 2-oxo acid dehydrogenase subunit E2 [Candidatus Limnocylindria bacterium]|jgi:pyruvate dehydrogenase E2 component (dihydrolipoamide acetyltransferase)|nr:2-oxo acid dehydrogenase subunit E2 [Candidatus Limnocylindria bacterium]